MQKVLFIGTIKTNKNRKENKTMDKNFEIACDLADDLYFTFIDSLYDDIANEYVTTDEENGGTKNTEKGSELYWQIENTIQEALNKQKRKVA